MRFQFRLDMFNAFNHANFYSAEYYIWDSGFGTINASLESAADAGSSQALLVMRGANNQGCCGCLLLRWCLSCRGLHPRNNPIHLNLSWPRRNKPRPGVISSPPPSSTGKRQRSILKSPNSEPISG